MIAAITAYDHLPGADHPLFHRLLGERRLRIGRDAPAPDVVDELSARLVCAALAGHQRLLLVLPDARMHRPALLLTTAILRLWLDTRETGATGGGGIVSDRAVLYAGAYVGIREQLSQSSIAGMNLSLAEVFRQRDLSRQGSARAHARSSQPAGEISSTLPRVVTLYAPVDPRAAIAELRPGWLAIDCGDAPRLAWLEPLLAAAIERDLSIIAWSQNPLSDCVATFAQVGHVIAWPPSPARPRVVCAGLNDSNPVISERSGSEVKPLVVAGAGAEAVSNTLSEASRALVAASRTATSRLLIDAVRLHWGYLRTIETLSVPVDFFESEAPGFWGIKTLAQYRGACERFREACLPLDPLLASHLEVAGISVERALDAYRQTEPTFWNALCQLIVEEQPPDDVRLITFSGRARKQMFLLALLARHNITEDDLRSLRTWVMTPDDLRRLQLRRDGLVADTWESNDPSPEARWHPLLVGVPGSALIPKLLPVMRQEAFEVLVSPHQTGALRRRVREWNERLGSSHAELARALRMLGASPSLEAPAQGPEYLRLLEPQEVDAGGARRSTPGPPQRLWALDDPTAEIAHLFDDGLEDDSDASALREEPSTRQGAVLRPNAAPAFVDYALEIEFAEGWRTQLALDETVQIVITGTTGFRLDERFVSAVRPGDRVLFIQGQARQSLYDLILSRVHHHPTIELHLALIRRWQSDAALAYGRWRFWGVRNHEALLVLLQGRGSALRSSLTVAQWLRGMTLCPQDPEDLRRLAEVLEMGFVHTHYRRIHRAASRLRGLHRGLSNRLNRWLEGQINGIAVHGVDDVIDAELGLTFSDIRDSLLVLRVSAVQRVAGPFLPDALGHLEKVR